MQISCNVVSSNDNLDNVLPQHMAKNKLNMLSLLSTILNVKIINFDLWTLVRTQDLRQHTKFSEKLTIKSHFNIRSSLMYSKLWSTCTAVNVLIFWTCNDGKLNVKHRPYFLNLNFSDTLQLMSEVSYILATAPSFIDQVRVPHENITNMLTKNAASSQHPLYRLVWLVFLIAADNAVPHIMIFQYKTEDLQPVSSSTTPIAELCVAATACHVIASLRPLDIHLNNSYRKCRCRWDFS